MPTTTVYFVDRAIRFTDKREADGNCYVADDDEAVCLAKVIKIFETFNEIRVYDPSGRLFGRFAADFRWVEAAGGIVRNPQGEVLMIQFNNRWDLPKGHIEPGEEASACAVREIAEETGIGGAKIERHLCNTLHAYDVYGAWELKCTHWFALSVGECRQPVPQAEEGIAEAVWCGAERTARNLQQTYPTIRDVFDEFVKG